MKKKFQYSALLLFILFVITRETGFLNLRLYAVEVETKERLSSVSTNLIYGTGEHVEIDWNGFKEVLTSKSTDDENDFKVILHHIEGNSNYQSFLPLYKTTSDINATFYFLDKYDALKGEIYISKQFKIGGLCSTYEREEIIREEFKDELVDLMWKQLGVPYDVTCWKQTNFNDHREWSWRKFIRLTYFKNDSRDNELEIPCRTIFIPDARGSQWTDTFHYAGLINPYEFAYNVIEYDSVNQNIKTNIYYKSGKLGLSVNHWTYCSGDNENPSPFKSREPCYIYKKDKLKIWDKNGELIYIDEK